MHADLRSLLLECGAIVRRDHPALRGRIDAAVKRGELIPVLPGVFVQAGIELDWRLHALAACAYHPDVVITGKSAAALGGLFPGKTVQQVSAYHRECVRGTGPVVWHRNPVPPQWRIERGGLRYAAPAWAAVEVAGSGEADSLDEALLRGVPLAELWRAFGDMPNRPGNKVRRQFLTDSRDEPWSAAERQLHRLLRQAGIKGWRTNLPVLGYHLDLAWAKEKVEIEVDGFEHHGSRESFERDRMRDQVLVAHGWTVLRVTWAQLQHDPEGFLNRLRRVLRRQRALAA